jgi:hypothetical protein
MNQPTHRFRRAVAHTLLVLSLGAVTVLAKPSGPLDVSVSPDPTGMQSGETATSTLHFTALQDLDRVRIVLSVIEGLEIAAPPEIVLTGLKQNEQREVSITVRLVAPKYGDLSVIYEAVGGGKTTRGATGITYGSSKE